eukprot:398666-Prymnesium_polylepis.3
MTTFGANLATGWLDAGAAVSLDSWAGPASIKSWCTHGDQSESATEQLTPRCFHTSTSTRTIVCAGCH